MSTDIRRKWSVPEDFTSASGGQGKAWLALRKTFEAFRKRKGLVLLLFLAACLYTIVSALSGPGKSDGTMSIEHIRRLDLRPENNTNPSKQLLR